MATAKQETAAKKTATKERKAGVGIHAPVQPSDDLAEIVGKDAIPRSDVISKVWDYIRKHDLQNPKDKREILADDNLKKIFGKDKATMFEMNKFISAHLKKAG